MSIHDVLTAHARLAAGSQPFEGRFSTRPPIESVASRTAWLGRFSLLPKPASAGRLGPSLTLRVG